MKIILVFLFLFLGCLKNNILFDAKLSSTSDASGKASVELFDKTINWEMELINVPNITMAHFHCKSNDAVAATLIPKNTWEKSRSSKSFLIFSGVIFGPDLNNRCNYKSLDELVIAMKEEKTYINVHTKEHPGGLIKGDLVLGPSPHRLNFLDYR